MSIASTVVQPFATVAAQQMMPLLPLSVATPALDLSMQSPQEAQMADVQAMAELRRERALGESVGWTDGRVLVAAGLGAGVGTIAWLLWRRSPPSRSAIAPRAAQ